VTDDELETKLADALARTVDAIKGAFAKMEGRSDAQWLGSLNDDEAAIVGVLLSRSWMVNGSQDG
jgi:hypothetical protein